MKNFLPATLLIVLTALFTTKTHAQLIVSSTAGYNVTVNVKATEILPTAVQASGYNYNVRLTYSVTFSGNMANANLWTLQGTIGCGTSSHWFDLPETQSSGTTVSTSNQWATGSPSNATVATMNCKDINITISGNGITSRTIAVPAAAVLPVQMASFTASFDFNKVSLNWSTASEANNAYFTIERSADGTNYSSLAKVNGAGNSSALISYSYSDLSPVNGTSYYRIRQTDIDGNTTVSEVKTVKNNSTAKNITVFPIPNTGNTINVAGVRDFRNYDLAVVGSTGAALYQTNLTTSSVTLPSLAKGFYFIRLTDKMSGETTNIRYVKN